jgi:hypothetical protein
MSNRRKFITLLGGAAVRDAWISRSSTVATSEIPKSDAASLQGPHADPNGPRRNTE